MSLPERRLHRSAGVGALQNAMSKASKRFSDHRKHAKARGIDWRMSFVEWFGLWESSGKYALCGRRADEYCMARNGDSGAYEIDNVHICTVAENHREQTINKRRHRCPGERNGNAKITETTVHLIRADDRTHEKIAVHHGVSESLIRQIKKRQVWAHVT